MDEMKSIPYIVYEASEARSERHIKRLTIALVIAIILSTISNIVWLWAWNQYEYEETSVTEARTYIQDGQGLNIIGNSNEVDNGASSDIHKDVQD